ncbi:hypothetical protein K439DRAFT_1633626 [Ramaria rubella]|nr:hypothetical protein K439DRAFT_1633626 [Ramaria rubella]
MATLSTRMSYTSSIFFSSPCATAGGRATAQTESWQSLRENVDGPDSDILHSQFPFDDLLEGTRWKESPVM